jgi:trigger factor
MASVTQENIGVNHNRIKVIIEPQDYKANFEKNLKKFASTANLPGFRKGMVPVAQVKKMHGQALFSEEILRLAGSQIDAYVQKNAIKFFGRPLPTANANNDFRFDMNADKNYEFDFEIGLQPEFTIPVLDGKHTLKTYKVVVTESMVDEEVEKMRLKAGKMTEPESIIGDDDVLNISLSICDVVGNIDNSVEKKTNSLLVKYFNESFKPTLIGKKANETIVFKLSEALDPKVLPAVVKDLGLDPMNAEHKNTLISMHIDKLGHIEKAAVEIGLFEDVYKGQNITTEEQFREKLVSEIEMYWAQQSKIRLHNEIYETLVHDTPIDLPVSFLKRWMREGGEKLRTLEEVEKEYSGFEHTLRWQLVSDKLASENKITATKEEMEQGVKYGVMQYFSQMGLGASDGTEEWLQPIIDKQMADPKHTEEIYNKIVTDKLFYGLEQQFNLQEELVSVEEFMTIPSSHHHHHHH